MKLSQLQLSLESLWPQSSADDWDNVGLSVGVGEHEVSKVLLSVDVTNEVINEAIAQDADLLISHHPLLLGGIMEITDASYRGILVHKSIRSGLAIYSAHTNADITKHGVSWALADAVGLKTMTALDGMEIGHGRIGSIEPITISRLVDLLISKLPATKGGIRVIGDSSQVVSKIALVAGSGFSFHEQAMGSGAEVFVTSDLKHHAALDFKQQYPDSVLIDISHYAAESVWLDTAVNQLRQLHPELIFEVSQINTDPWDNLFTND